MATAQNDTFCSLDMLAEVASATLINDSSLSFNSSPRKAKLNSKIGTNAPKKSLNSSDKLTLDQIKVLSDKLLIEMFSELTCDEIRKNYSFKCFLIPDKCSQIFKSFGSEARARCKMKMHLQCHINDLILEANVKTCDIFTAEPLHIRRKRLKELNSKNVRKRKKSKQQITKKKKDGLSDNYSDIGSSKLNFQHTKKSLKYPTYGLTSETNLNIKVENDSGYNQQFSSASEQTFADTSQIQAGSTIESEQTNISNNIQEEFYSISSSKSYTGKKIKRKKMSCNSSQSDYVVKWDTDFDNASLDSSNVFDFDASYYSPSSHLPSHHDHTYTSIRGKTYTCDSECNKASSKTLKAKKPSYHCIDPSMILPSPPFPFVYIPLLPHAAEVQEIRTTSKLSSYKYSNDSGESILKKNLKISNELIFTKDLQSNQTDDILRFEEHEQDFENVSDTFLYEERVITDQDDQITIETDLSKISSASFNVDDLETDCPPNLQSVEKKLALKYIRALRTKKKEERGPLICQICKNKSFTAQATLLYHYRSHAGIKPFSCTVCEATFTRQHSLKYHMLIHYNKSRFVCSDCGRSFRHPSHFKEHLRRHTGETPYECTDCNLRFKTRNTYKRHLKTRHGKILTMNGIHRLPDEEFCKVRTSPRKKEAKTSVSHKNDQDMQWWKIVFPEKDFYS